MNTLPRPGENLLVDKKTGTRRPAAPAGSLLLTSASYAHTFHAELALGAPNGMLYAETRLQLGDEAFRRGIKHQFFWEQAETVGA
jgi:hypothetical protein